jgi:hypothetical protein
MRRSQSIQKFIEDLPDTITSKEGWHGVVPKLAQLAGCPHGFISARRPNGDLQLEAEKLWENDFIHGYDGESGITQYTDYYRHFDELSELERTAVKTPVIASHARNFHFSPKSEFWDWATRLEFNDSAYVKLFDLPDGYVGMNLQFGNQTTDSARVLSVLEAVQRPIADCLKIQQLGYSQCFNDTIEAQLNAAAEPKILLSQRCKSIHHNKAFETYLGASDALFMKQGRLFLATPSNQSEFEAAFHRVCATRMPQAIRFNDSDTLSPTNMVMAPYELNGYSMLENSIGVLVTLATKVEDYSVLEGFGRANGLTPRQITILMKVAEGKPVRKIASELGISYEYTRSVLYKDIFPSLHVSDLAELVALLGRIYRAMQ